MNRKKELKEQYRQLKPEMGVFMIRSNRNNKCLIEGTLRLNATINRVKFQLDFGSYPNRELQKEWKEYGEANFTFRILENLEYEKDETKTDYSDELELLQMDWEERMAKQDFEFYMK
ncbi:hypothetical protein Desor_3534 [Desulfosporosinus orientis DSM 765]|uniref:GIY-YIG domain-containing protein n=1 Tax=Desulfosporosinus orientis (strain ATCC 19365 / DSM 765 / NCIMB 8382 / VKM B-1628 / Singapore I) TaxID=768706 RepID=G7WH03_DESOD|nr:GIY-YIG nuclease family protein [Desulfosporosinus orientis]AET69017.1 hypothetical protein Desor_3534 [Desulfosporosinus orientis DSM 765]